MAALRLPFHVALSQPGCCLASSNCCLFCGAPAMRRMSRAGYASGAPDRRFKIKAVATAEQSGRASSPAKGGAKAWAAQQGRSLEQEAPLPPHPEMPRGRRTSFPRAIAWEEKATVWVLAPQFASAVVRVPLPQENPTNGARGSSPIPQGTALTSGWRGFLMSLLLVPAGAHSSPEVPGKLEAPG